MPLVLAVLVLLTSSACSRRDAHVGIVLVDGEVVAMVQPCDQPDRLLTEVNVADDSVPTLVWSAEATDEEESLRSVPLLVPEIEGYDVEFPGEDDISEDTVYTLNADDQEGASTAYIKFRIEDVREDEVLLQDAPQPIYYEPYDDWLACVSEGS